MITVKELIGTLEKLDPNASVILSSDPEGNQFSHLYAIDPYLNMFNEKEGFVGVRELTNANKRYGHTDDDVVENGLNCIVLFPE